MSALLYTTILRLALPFLLLRLWWRGRAERAYRDSVAERLGIYSGEVAPRLLWIHAVSVGEARAAEPLARAMQREWPDHVLLFTCTTAAGRETLHQLFGAEAAIVWLPYDFPETTRAFLQRFRPRLGVLMETELWPNLLAACEECRVPVVLANARMSEKSARGYRRFDALSRPALARLAAVCAQSEEDAARLRALGAREVRVTGNLKFDVQPDAAQLDEGAAWRERAGRPVVLLASTREGEEDALLDAWADASGAALAVVVPRHARRFEEVARRADARRSVSALPPSGARVFLGDSMGEMAFYYGACDVAIMGGSFAPLGGQNLIEALACGVPVVLGPHMFNFAEATRLALDAGAAVQVPDAQAAVRLAAELLRDQTRCERMSESGKALCLRHRGATREHVAVCRHLLEQAAA